MDNKSAPEYKKHLWNRLVSQREGIQRRILPQVTFRYPDNQGITAANVNLAWNAKNTTKIITAVEQLNDLMTQKNLSLKAVE